MAGWDPLLLQALAASSCFKQGCSWQKADTRGLACCQGGARTFALMSLTFHATPATPCLFPPTAPMVPETCLQACAGAGKGSEKRATSWEGSLS